MRSQVSLAKLQDINHYIEYNCNPVAQTKESACSVEDLGLIPGSGRSPGEGNGNPTSGFLSGEPMD